MTTLTQEQIEAVIDWLNNWEQLKGTSIPLRFKEDWTKRIKEPVIENILKTFVEEEGYDIGKINYPEFDVSKKVHNWRNYVLDGYKENWNRLTKREKTIIFIRAEFQADSEEWE